MNNYDLYSDIGRFLTPPQLQRDTIKAASIVFTAIFYNIETCVTLQLD